jgi:hypothetical protein
MNRARHPSDDPGTAKPVARRHRHSGLGSGRLAGSTTPEASRMPTYR